MTTFGSRINPQRCTIFSECTPAIDFFDNRSFIIRLTKKPVTDKELIQGCIRENKACQRALYQRYAPKMMSVCLRYARHRLEAEDLLQEGFIKVFDNMYRFEFRGSFEGWVRRIMINTALKNYNKSSFKKERIGIHDYEGGSADPVIVAQLSREEIMAEVNRLPDGYRVVFNMYIVDGYSHKEIADQLGIGESTSRSQLVKARKMMQARIMELQKIRI